MKANIVSVCFISFNIIAFVKNFERIGIQIAALRSVCKIRAQIVDCAFVKFGCFVLFRF